LHFITKLIKSTKYTYSHLEFVTSPSNYAPSLRRGISFQACSKHEIGVACIEILIFRWICRACMYGGQLLALYNCMMFVMHEIRTFLRQYTKSVNEHRFRDDFMLILFAGAQNYFIEGVAHR
jgi:hypothetical protein